jgi:hypothetical protein
MSEPFEAQDELKLRPPKEKTVDLKIAGRARGIPHFADSVRNDGFAGCLAQPARWEGSTNEVPVELALLPVFPCGLLRSKPRIDALVQQIQRQRSRIQNLVMKRTHVVFRP